MNPGARRGAIAAIAVLALGLAGAGLLWRHTARRESGAEPTQGGLAQPADPEALARLEAIPLYRSLLSAKAIRSGRVDPEGRLHLEVDLRAVLEPRLAALGLAGASSLFPAFAKGTLAIDDATGASASTALRESWRLEGPAPALELLDRRPPRGSGRTALDAIPGSPSSMAWIRLDPSHLADPSFGGPALASWRDRAELAEQLLNRPLRAEIAEDLAGPAVFALYEGADATSADAVFAAELRRSDRLRGLLDMLFGLGALTEGVTVRRYRGVSTGSFVARSGGPGIALAVDGPVLFVATSRARLESAIDARRAGSHPRARVAAEIEPEASWSAASDSAFVRHGWSRLAHATSQPKHASIATTTASLRPEGDSGWRLEGHGPAPAITADPMLPFFRNAFARRQRGAD